MAQLAQEKAVGWFAFSELMQSSGHFLLYMNASWALSLRFFNLIIKIVNEWSMN